MAEENVELQTTQQEPRASQLKLMIIAAILIVVSAAVAFGVSMYAFKTVVPKEAVKGDGFGTIKSETLGTTYDAGEYITNLNTESGDRFIKVKIVFAFNDAKVKEELDNKFPEIQHTINSTLRQQTPQALSEQKSMEKLSELLMKNINARLIKGNINNLYFTTFVIQ